MSFDAFDIAASGMHAQRLKMDTISSNIANVNTTRNPDGTHGVYKKKEVSFQAVYNDKISNAPTAFPHGESQVVFNQQNGEMFLRGGIFFDENYISQGVQVASIQESKNPYKTIYDPSHPDADENGFLQVPNVNVVEEMVDMVSASKAYEANVVVAETTKSMMNTALKI